MKKILTLIVFLLSVQFCKAQVYADNYFYSYYLKKRTDSYLGCNSMEVKQLLFKHLYRYHYDGTWFQTDSSVEVAMTHDTASWIIYCAFYFDSTAKCYAYTIEHCDSFGRASLKYILKDPNYYWRKIGTDKYLSEFSKSELMEVLYEGNCLICRRTKLHLTRREYKALRATGKKE